jgi:hypothetical protein
MTMTSPLFIFSNVESSTTVDPKPKLFDNDKQESTKKTCFLKKWGPSLALAFSCTLSLLGISFLYKVLGGNFTLPVEAEVRISYDRSRMPSINFGSPFLVLTEGGCSGTTAVGVFLNKIVAAHGYKLNKNSGFEMLHVGQTEASKVQEKNPYYLGILAERNITLESVTKDEQKQIVIESIKRAQRVAIESKSLLAFKVNVRNFKRLHLMLDSFEPSYIGLYRENILDRCICMIRDCFHESKNFGISVFETNGTESKMCFQRRENPDVGVQAYFTDVQGCLAKDEKSIHFIRHQGYASVSSELLTLFEYSTNENDFKLSVDAWMIFLKPLLKNELKRELVLRTLEGFQGTRNQSSQKKYVYNYHQVWQELTSVAKWENFLKKEFEEGTPTTGFRPTTNLKGQHSSTALADNENSTGDEDVVDGE